MNVPLLWFNIHIVITRKPFPNKHYLIYGKHAASYGNIPMGCCYDSGKNDVMEEEPECRLVPVKRRKCPICNKNN